MNDAIDKILFNEEDIKGIVKRVAVRINNDYKDCGEILFIGILKGSIFFLSDLAREIDLPCKIDFMAVSSYDGAETSGEIKIIKDISASIKDRHVIIVEDIIDTGLTLKMLLRTLSVRNPKSLKTAALLDKHERRQTEIEGDYVGERVPNEFIVGYGLDYNEQFRTLPVIATLKTENKD